LSSLKDMTLQIERNFLNKIDFLNSIRSNVRNNQTTQENDDPKFMKIRENLKDVLYLNIIFFMLILIKIIFFYIFLTILFFRW
jgi:hypothetical protein